ncbi:uncharacterized protein B0H64DRAFT_145706 [Chaetomium fimeti]|uniref:N-acetyltransferase domain-containing protein n=1 Tax=Chaetomium fimeti TaxID=1854472 RepID=A0AAE0HF62_9PEZI|nr:hypothetical protein B0H64DRAFT_145706 [Chaetomium fimeti]
MVAQVTSAGIDGHSEPTMAVTGTPGTMDVGTWTRLVFTMNRQRQKDYRDMGPDALICRILHLIIHPDSQRHRHGSSILGKLCEQMDDYKAHGIVTAPSALFGWYRRFGFEMSGRLLAPFEGLYQMVRKPAGAGDISDPEPSPTMQLDSASQAKAFAEGLSYELMMPKVVDAVGPFLIFAGNAYRMLRYGEAGELVKLVVLGTGQPAESTAGRLAESTGDGVVARTAAGNEAEHEPAEMQIEQPGTEEAPVEQPWLTNGHIGQPEPTETHAEKPDTAEQPEPTNTHVEQPGPSNSHNEQPEPTQRPTERLYKAARQKSRKREPKRRT